MRFVVLAVLFFSSWASADDCPNLIGQFTCYPQEKNLLPYEFQALWDSENGGYTIDGVYYNLDNAFESTKDSQVKSWCEMGTAMHASNYSHSNSPKVITTTDYIIQSVDSFEVKTSMDSAGQQPVATSALCFRK